MTPAEMERLLDEHIERHYSTGYETSGFYVLSRSNVDDFIEYAISLAAETAATPSEPTDDGGGA